MNTLFDTKDKIDMAVANFKDLKLHAGWQLLKQIVDANIEVLSEQILNGVEGDTKESIDRKRDKLKAYKEVIGTPDYWIKQFESPIPFQDDDDPFYDESNIKETRQGS